jgi:hypothetical protein
MPWRSRVPTGWIVATFCGAIVFAVGGAIVFYRPCVALLYSWKVAALDMLAGQNEWALLGEGLSSPTGVRWDLEISQEELSKFPRLSTVAELASIMKERFWEFTGIGIYMCFHMYFLRMVAALVKAPRWGWVYRP